MTAVWPECMKSRKCVQNWRQRWLSDKQNWFGAESQTSVLRGLSSLTTRAKRFGHGLSLFACSSSLFSSLHLAYVYHVDVSNSTESER